MNDLIAPSALCDLQGLLMQPRVATVMAGVAVMLGVLGPFETGAAQNLPMRMPP